MKVIELKDVKKSYGKNEILHGISLDIEEGSIHGLVGRNGCGKTTIVMIQGIVGAFLVRIPVAYVMSKIEPVSLFRVGLATPSSTVVQIIICGVYLFFLSRTLFKKEETNDAPNHELCDAEA